MITADELANQLVDATVSAVDVLAIAIGDQLGDYRALRDSTLTAAELAEATTTSQRYTREWLEQQAVSGLIELAAPDAEPDARRYRLRPGTREVLAAPARSPTSPRGPPDRRRSGPSGAPSCGARGPVKVAGRRTTAPTCASRRPTSTPRSCATTCRAGWPRYRTPQPTPRGERLRIADIGCGAGWYASGWRRPSPACSSTGRTDPETVRLPEKIVRTTG